MEWLLRSKQLKATHGEGLLLLLLWNTKINNVLWWQKYVTEINSLMARHYERTCPMLSQTIYKTVFKENISNKKFNRL